MLEHFTIPGLSLIAFLLIGIVQGLIVGVFFLMRMTGNKKANNAFGWLLILFSIALIRSFINRMGWIEADKSLFFLPLWNILFFGPLLFLGVKFSLYPGYQFRASDLKHLILPFLHMLLYWWVFLMMTPEAQVLFFENTFNPTYKILEGVAFIIMLFGYLALAYRYIKFKQATLKKFKGYVWERLKTRQLNRMVKGFLILAALNTFYVIADFIAYYFYGELNMFGWLGDFSFALILYWLGYNGYKLMFPFIKQWRSGSHTKKETQPAALVEALSQLFEKDKWYLNSELRPHHLAKRLQTDTHTLTSAVQSIRQETFFDWINDLRAAELTRRMNHTRYAKHATLSMAYDVGFPSKREFLKYFKRHTGQTPSNYRKSLPH